MALSVVRQVAVGIPQQGFYEVGATVIPVLFLALLVQLRWFENEERTAPRLAIFDLTTIIVAVVGEIVCLSALSDDRAPSEIAKLVVLCAITLMFLPIINRAARPRLEALAKGWPWAISAFGVFVFGLAIVGVGLSFAHVRFMDVLAGGAILLLFAVLGGSIVADDWEAGRLDFLKRKRGGDGGDDREDRDSGPAAD